MQPDVSCDVWYRKWCGLCHRHSYLVGFHARHALLLTVISAQGPCGASLCCTLTAAASTESFESDGGKIVQLLPLPIVPACTMTSPLCHPNTLNAHMMIMVSFGCSPAAAQASAAKMASFDPDSVTTVESLSLTTFIMRETHDNSALIAAVYYILFCWHAVLAAQATTAATMASFDPKSVMTVQSLSLTMFIMPETHDNVCLRLPCIISFLADMLCLQQQKHQQQRWRALTQIALQRSSRCR